MFTEVRQFLLGEGLRKLATVQTNARGDVTKEFVAVASGGADAYVDVRETLSPENYMAAYLIVTEAGGTVSDRFGKPLAPIRSMTQGQSIVAASTPALHAAILEVLDRYAAEG